MFYFKESVVELSSQCAAQFAGLVELKDAFCWHDCSGVNFVCSLTMQTPFYTVILFIHLNIRLFYISVFIFTLHFYIVLRRRGKLITFLRMFFTHRPARTVLKQSGIVKERVFGCDLGEHLSNSSRHSKWSPSPSHRELLSETSRHSK